MTNPWIEHVKKYAKDNNISYGCAITEAKKTYVKKSATKPAKNKAPEPVVTKATEPKPKPDEDDFDDISSKLQQLLYSSGKEKIIKALTKLNYKGRIEANAILRTMQILKNFNTIAKMKSLIKELN